MDSKSATLEGPTALSTPAVSLHRQDSRIENIEMGVFNKSQNDVPQSELSNTVAEMDEATASRQEAFAMMAVCWTQFMVRDHRLTWGNKTQK